MTDTIDLFHSIGIQQTREMCAYIRCLVDLLGGSLELGGFGGLALLGSLDLFGITVHENLKKDDTIQGGTRDVASEDCTKDELNYQKMKE